MKLGCAFGDAFSRARVHFIQRKSVGPRRIGRAAEGAKFAMRDAHVRGIDVPVDVVVGDVAVLFFAHEIRQPADAKQVVRFVQQQAVSRVQAFTRQDLPGHRIKPFIAQLQSFKFNCCSHLRDILGLRLSPIARY